MFQKSISAKLILIIVVCFFGMGVLSLLTFIDIYAKQLESEAMRTKIRADRLLQVMAENRELRDELAWHKSFVNRDDAQLEIIRQSLFEERKVEFTKQRLVKSTVQRFWTGLFAMGVILVLLIFLLKFFVTRPVEKLRQASERLSQGNLSTRVKLPNKKEKNYDELETLGKTLNQMAENLQKTLEEVKERERFSQSLIDAIPDGIRVIDENYREITVNKAFKKMLGREKGYICGLCYAASYGRKTPCGDGMVSCPLTILKKDEKPVSVIHRYVKKDGKEIPVEVNAAVLGYKKNDKDSMMIVESIRDLGSDIRFSHQQKLSSVGLIATSVAHDLRNALGSIKLVLDNLVPKMRDDGKDGLKSYMTMIDDQIAVCLETTERLLNIGRYSEETEKIDISRAIKETIALIDYESKKQGVEIIFNEKPGRYMAKGRGSELRMVFLNILQNALNAMHKTGGRIRVSLSEKEQRIMIKIKDTGPGIPTELINRIFDPFFRARDGKKSGAGLGLAIVRTIIEGMDGKITLKSDLGKGAEFTVTIPKAEK